MGTLSPQDLELLDILRRRVRVLSLAQVAREWWPMAGDPMRSATRQVERLAAAHHVERCHFFARPEMELAAPLATWQRGLSRPDFHAVARAARRRWVDPPTTVRCLVAARAGNRGGRAPRETEVTHDVHLAQVYLRLRRALPSRARSWRGETSVQDLPRRDATADSVATDGQKLPDAVVCDGRHYTAIEMVGESYRAEKLLSFHTFCASHGLGYELW